MEQIRLFLLDLWLKEASPTQIKAFRSTTDRYKSFGQIREAVRKGDYDWMFFAP